MNHTIFLMRASLLYSQCLLYKASRKRMNVIFYFFNAGGNLMTSFEDEAVTIKGTFLCVAPGDRIRHLLLVSHKRQRLATRTTIYNYLPTNRKSLHGLSFHCMKTVTYFTAHPKHVNQGSLFKSKNRSGTAITEGLPWRHPTPDPRGPIRFCAILESRNRLFVFGSHLKQLSESHGRLRITPPLLLLMSTVKTRA